MRATYRIIFTLILIGLGTIAPVPAQTALSRDSITASGIRRHVYFLAGEELGGRWPGSPGLWIATQYAASQFRAAGLVPVFKDGETPSYLQIVPLVRRSVKPAPVLKVRSLAGEQTFVHGEDFKWFSGSPTGEDGKILPVVRAGYAIGEPESGWDDLRGLDVEGKVVILKMGIPPQGLPDVLRVRYSPRNSFMRKITDLIPRKPAALFIAPDPEIDAQWNMLPTIDASPPFAYKDRAPDGINIPFIGFLKTDVGKALLPAGAGGWDQAGAIPGVSIVLQSAAVDEEIQAWNAAGLVPGRDPALKDQIVIVSAHLDHLVSRPGEAVFAGANDNASGSAAVMEIAEAMASQPCRRSVLFVLFTAEEGGDMGALHFLSRPPFPRGRIVADVNMDMIGRNEADSPDQRAQYVLDSDVIQPAFTRLIQKVNDRTVGWPLKFVHPAGLGDSDHRIFEAFRIPAVNFYTGKVADTHKPTDTPDKIDYNKAEKIARLVFETARELAERESPWK